MRSVTLALLAAIAAAGLTGCGGSDTIEVVRATYGASCGQPPGNVSLVAASLCRGTAPCAMPVSIGALGDPAPGCEKDFEVRWAFRSGPPRTRRLYLPAEFSSGGTARLTSD